MNIVLIGNAPVLDTIGEKVIEHQLTLTRVPSFSVLRNHISKFTWQTAPAMVIGRFNQQKDNPQVIEVWRKHFPYCRFFALIHPSEIRQLSVHLTHYFDGLALETEEPKVLSWAIRKVFNGATFVSPELNRIWLQVDCSAGGTATSNHTTEKLYQYGITYREREIIDLLSENYSYKQIANALNLSVNTVRFYAHSSYKKLNVRNRTQLIKVLKSPTTPCSCPQAGILESESTTFLTGLTSLALAAI